MNTLGMDNTFIYEESKQGPFTGRVKEVFEATAHLDFNLGSLHELQ